MSRRRVLLAVTAVVVGACGGKKDSASNAPPPEVTGLAAVPASAEAVVGVDLAKLVGAPAVERVIDQLFLHDANLEQRWSDVAATCKLDLGKSVKRVMLALGPHVSTPGTGPVLLIATGKFVESDVEACVRTIVGKGGGTLTAKTDANAGRTIYTAKDGNRAIVFAFGRADTLVLGSNEAYVTEALTPSGPTAPKLVNDPDAKPYLAMVDQNAPIWGIGRVDPRVAASLVKHVSGIKAGPKAVVGTLDLTAGAKVAAGVVMASPEDAKALESFAKTQLGQFAAAAALIKLDGPIKKVTTSVDGATVRLAAAFTVDDLNQLISALDGGDPPKQDAPSQSPTTPPAEKPATPP
jgi:hypothetical protein